MSWWKRVTGTAKTKGDSSRLSDTGEAMDLERLPKHIAVIMDGNGRWAASRGLPRSAGHKAGVEALRRTVKACHALGISYLTVYAFSTENWRRPASEVSFLMQLLIEGLRTEIEDLTANGVKLQVIGDVIGLPKDLQDAVAEAVKRTELNQGLQLQIALNYGGRAEIVSACRKVVAAVQAGQLQADQLTEDVFSKYLFTSGVPDPDLIIRTGGEQRLSNFLLWQAAYSEIWVTDVYWPDFDEKLLRQALWCYLKRERRFGGLGAQQARQAAPSEERN